ncbi:hypothetical protein [Halalkalibacillus halophilus]|uniref:hypothetical protein n=1 Tax=Halalkalibacillus halophilus TaxID=392827 RepID=UPI000419DBCE|nr:hypothetical protein [Halalkalibacillus halophilus]
MGKNEILKVEVIFSFITLLLILGNFIFEMPYLITIALFTGSVMLGCMGIRRMIDERKVLGSIFFFLAAIVLLSGMMEIFTR